MKKTIISLIVLTTFAFTVNAQKTGKFKDKRDGQKYKTVKIGKQVWMAENLAYKPLSGKYRAYKGDISNIAVYGYLYAYETAKKVCPDGWHLPSRAEFERLANLFGGIKTKEALVALKDGGRSRFNALFGGYGYVEWRTSYEMGYSGNFMSSTEDDGHPFILSVHKGYGAAMIHYGHNDRMYSVRCVKNY